MTGSLSMVIGTVSSRDDPIGTARVATYRLPQRVSVNPESSRTGVYDATGNGRTPSTPLFVALSNRLKPEVRDLFKVFKRLRIRKSVGKMISKESVDKAFIRFINEFTTLNAPNEKLIKYLPLYSEKRYNPVYTGYVFRKPKYILYVDRIGGGRR